MKTREVLIGILFETNASIRELRNRYLACLCDKVTLDGKRGKILKVSVHRVTKVGKP